MHAILRMLIALPVVALGACNERQFAAITHEGGHKKSGDKFGVVVGEDCRQAVASLTRNGWSYVVGHTDPKDCRKAPEITFLDNEHPPGLLALGVKQGRISYITWEYGK